jgi:peptidoglycan/xylan/chitin deacetylase (PgdA/CDA1 family)
VKISSFGLSVFMLLFLCFPSAGEKLTYKKELPPVVCVPILLYHRFGSVIADSMTVSTNVFESHLKYLSDNGYTVIPLRQLVNYYLKKGPPPPPRSVVITADDGHKSVYTDMFPLVKRYHIPVTLFLYPSSISNALYAMTWDQLREMKKTGLFDFQSHSYWHPNFKKDKKRLKQTEYEKFVDVQFRKSKEKLEKELGVKVDMLAWPFGIYDDELVRKARVAGYIAAFTLERRLACASDNIMILPRYLMTDTYRGKALEKILEGNPDQCKINNY